MPDHGRPLNIAHRGASAYAPENTLAAFRLALEMGADGFELDVMLSADGHLVVIHDDTADRTTDGSGPVQEKTLAELKALDAGARFDARFAGERIPTLREIFDLVAGDRAFVNVEIKTDSLKGDGLEEKLVALIRRYGLGECLLISSFNPFALWRMRRLAPDLPLALLYAEDQRIHLRDRWFAFLSHPDALNPSFRMATQEHVRRAKSKGHRLYVWTVDEEKEMRRLIALGVDGIITNKPDLLRQVLAHSVEKSKSEALSGLHL
jgi:glycerophosphoryl diester phosphodiesterase